MTKKTTEFAKRVAQGIEFAGFGPCAATGSVISVQAFAGMKNYLVAPNLTIAGIAKDNSWMFPSHLTPSTLAISQIIEDAYVSGGMEAPGSSACIKIESPELPFSIEVRYLWLDNPARNSRTVVARLFSEGKPVWASESLINYFSKKDLHLSDRVKTLLDTYANFHPKPDTEILEIIPEIIDTVEHL